MESANKKIYYGWWVLLGLFMFMFVSMGFLFNSFSLFTHTITESLDFSITSYVFIYTVIGLAGIPITLLVGWLVNKMDIRVLTAACAIIFIGAIILFSQGTELIHFYVGAGLAMFGITGLGPAVIAQIVNNWFIKRKGLVLAIAMAGSGVGGAVFSWIIPALITGLGWRAGLIVIAIIIAVIALPFCVFVIRLKPEDKGLKPYGYEEENSKADDKAVTFGLTLKEALKTPAFYLLFLSQAVVLLYVTGIQNLAPYAMETSGLDLAFVGIVMSITNTVLIGGKALFGWLNDKVGVRNALFYIFGVGILTIIPMYFFVSEAAAIIWAILFGLSAATGTIGFPLWTSAVIGNKDFAFIFSILSVGNTIGLMAATPLYAYLYEMTGTYALSWSTSMGFVILGFIVTFAGVVIGSKYLTKIKAAQQGSSVD